MTFTLKSWALLVLAIAAIGLSSWSVFISSQTTQSANKKFSGIPDAFMEDVVAIMLNKNGTPSLRIETPKMVHFPENDTINFLSPHIMVYRESPEPWHINSKHAKTQQGISEITFWDDVTIEHQADSDNPLTTMRTSTLTVLPEKKIAKTNAAVTVTQPNATVQAIGMLADWENGTIKLLSQAREEYVPPS